jgi:serine/threonine-protein kinase RsbW
MEEQKNQIKVAIEAVYHLEFSSEIKSISLVEAFVEDICKTFQVGDDTYGNILISITEAANNAILHGNKSDSAKQVVIDCVFDDALSRLVFTVKDQGNGFDHNSLPDPTAPENLHLPCGRGVFLMMQLADLVVFSDKGATVELQFKV